MNQRLRLLMAALLAPACLPTIYFLGMFLFSGYVRSDSGHLLKLFQETLLGILPVSYIVSGILGVPIFAILRKLQRWAVKPIVLTSCFAGFYSGLLMTFIFSGGPEAPSVSMSQRFVWVAIGAISALIVSVIFCFIGKVPSRTVG